MNKSGGLEGQQVGDPFYTDWNVFLESFMYEAPWSCKLGT